MGCSGGSCSAPSSCSFSDTLVRPSCCQHGLPSLVVCSAGSSFSTRSSLEKLAAPREAVAASFKNMRMIVTAGWSICPLGYLFGYLLGSVDDAALNLVYNLADFVNNIAFCLAIWSCAKSSSLEGGK